MLWKTQMSNESHTPHGRLRLARQRAQSGKFRQTVDAPRFFGWNEDTYKAHENGIRNYPRKAALKYARAFNVTAGWLLFGDGINDGSQNVRKGAIIAALTLPLIPWPEFRSAMTISEVIDKSEMAVEIPAIVPLSPLAFVTTLGDEDDSMVPFPPAPGDFFPPGTFLILDPEGSPRPGEFVLARVDDHPDTVFRRYREIPNGNHDQVELVALNSNYKPLRGVLGETVHIQGRYKFDIKPRR